MSREAMQMALEALESDPTSLAWLISKKQAITALRQTLEEKQEPVAWRYALDASVEGPRWIYIDKDPHQWLKGPSLGHALIEPLYTAPPKQWVGLTDEDMEALFLNEDGVRFARYIEAKLKERNT